MNFEFICRGHIVLHYQFDMNPKQGKVVTVYIMELILVFDIVVRGLLHDYIY